MGNGSAPVSIDGLRPGRIEAPENATEIAALLAEAQVAEQAVAPFGGGSSLALGNIPDRVDIGLSTEKVRGVIDYEPTDLTLSVAAGSVFADVQAVLAEHGQTLPIEVPHPERSTIGGLIATALAGPRRFGAGSLRDLLIGISAAHPSGTVTKAGGMVVKNVTGFDLMRLYLGSLGTLGVIVSANFKVLPLPRAERTLLASFSSWSAGLAAAEAIRTSRVQPVALELVRIGPEEWVLAVRIEGRDATVRLLSAEAETLVRADVQHLDTRESADWWRSYVADQGLTCKLGQALIRCTTNPKGVATALDRAVQLMDQQSGLNQCMVSPGLGALMMRIQFPGNDPAAELSTLRDALLSLWDHVVVIGADPALKHGLDVWGKPPETIEVMRSIKQEFDPGRVLNPGRFAGRI